MPKLNPGKLNKRREMISNRIANSNYPSREIQRIADELFVDKSTIYRDLESMDYPKTGHYYNNKHGFNGIT